MQLIVGGLFLCTVHTAATAGEPEQIDQLEPGKGGIQAEYFITLDEGEDGHAVEAMAGISDRLAAGFELEVETSASGVSFESMGPKLLYRFTGEGAPVSFGAQVQIGFGKGASIEEAELRLIAEAQDEHWWAQANGMLRRSRDDADVSTGLAYAWSLQRAIGGISWLGIEGSGQSAPISQRGAASIEHGHFLGPSLTFEIEPAAGHEIELGLAALRRISGDGSRETLRIFVQFSF